MPSTTLVFNPPVIAHRGASALAPENTLAAFRQAKALGIQWIEFDVMLAACGEVIVIHDETLDRTTNGHGWVRDYPYQYLKTLDAGSWFNPIFSGEKIPTLDETLEICSELGLSANIEIKIFPGKEKQLAESVLKILQKKNMIVPVLISSFSKDVLKFVREISTEVNLGYLMDDWDSAWPTICDELNCQAVDVNYKFLTRERVQHILSSDRLLLSYTVNDMTQAQELFSWGVSAVFSDYPDQILTKSHNI